MAVKWSFFVGAAAISWVLLLPRGAPLLALVIGTALVAGWNWWLLRREQRGPKT